MDERYACIGSNTSSTHTWDERCVLCCKHAKWVHLCPCDKQVVVRRAALMPPFCLVISCVLVLSLWGVALSALCYHFATLCVWLLYSVADKSRGWSLVDTHQGAQSGHTSSSAEVCVCMRVWFVLAVGWANSTTSSHAEHDSPPLLLSVHLLVFMPQRLLSIACGLGGCDA